MIDLSNLNSHPVYARIVKETKEVFVLDGADVDKGLPSEIQKYTMFEGRYGRAFQQVNMNQTGDLVISQSWYNDRLELCKDDGTIVILNKPEVLPGQCGYCQYSPAKIPCSGEWCDGGTSAFGTRRCPDRAKFEM